MSSSTIGSFSLFDEWVYALKAPVPGQDLAYESVHVASLKADTNGRQSSIEQREVSDAYRA